VKDVDIHEAKTHFSRLLNRVASGEEIVISRAGKPIARLVPIGVPVTRQLGRDLGVFTVPEDFDRPLPDDVMADFER
jgi:prevent-host-death family protein